MCRSMDSSHSDGPIIVMWQNEKLITKNGRHICLPSTSGGTVTTLPWFIPSTLAPSVVVQATEPLTACETELHSVLYKHVTPYIPSAWGSALRIANISHLFPHLVHNLSYGSPIGDPPPLYSTFTPKNLPSATILTDIIVNEICPELSTGHLSGPFTLDEVHIIFDGHFRTSPLRLVEKHPGDGKWRMIRHLSKTDQEGDSTNGWLDTNDFLTKYYSASMTADFVSPFSLFCHELPSSWVLPCTPLCHEVPAMGIGFCHEPCHSAMNLFCYKPTLP